MIKNAVKGEKLRNEEYLPRTKQTTRTNAKIAKYELVLVRVCSW